MMNGHFAVGAEAKYSGVFCVALHATRPFFAAVHIMKAILVFSHIFEGASPLTPLFTLCTLQD